MSIWSYAPYSTCPAGRVRCFDSRSFFLRMQRDDPTLYFGPSRAVTEAHRQPFRKDLQGGETLAGHQMITGLKSIAKEIPGIRFSVRYARDLKTRARLARMSAEEVFTEQFHDCDRGEQLPVSWDGSSEIQTQHLVQKLPVLLSELEISTLLDAGCGDFHWMNRAVSQEPGYLGVDIVAPLVERNTRKYARRNVEFRCLNLLEDEIPRSDLIICRDVLVLLSYRDAWRVIGNLCKSGSTYLLTNTYTARTQNRDIATGQWRVLNMERAPFNFPPPLQVLVEGCTEADGALADKSQGLWRLRDIAERLARAG